MAKKRPALTESDYNAIVEGLRLAAETMLASIPPTDIARSPSEETRIGKRAKRAVRYTRLADHFEGLGTEERLAREAQERSADDRAERERLRPAQDRQARIDLRTRLLAMHPGTTGTWAIFAPNELFDGHGGAHPSDSFITLVTGTWEEAVDKAMAHMGAQLYTPIFRAPGE